jgi:hypothetical protein
VNTPTLVIKRNTLKAANLVNVKYDAFKVIYSAYYVLGPCLLLLSVLIEAWCPPVFSQTMMPYVYTITLCIVNVHGAVFYKLTRNEFRMKIPDNIDIA